MKILNINSYYYSSSVHDQLRKSLSNIDVNTITYFPTSKKNDIKVSKEDKTIHISKCYRKEEKYIFHLKHKRILEDVVEKYDFDNINCIHAHSLFSNGYIALHIKKKFKIPYIVAVRDTDVNTFFKYMLHLRRLGVEILKEADKIVFLSDAYKKQVINKYIPNRIREEIQEKAIVIPNGIDDYWHDNKGESKKLSNNQNVKFLYVGALSKRKNLSSSIEALKKLIYEGYDVEFNVIGKKIDQSVFEEIRKTSFINYESPKEKEKLKSIYRENDIFIMPSLTESFGLVYAEALSQGLPIIYSEGQGFDEQFENGFVGYKVKSKSSKEISIAVKKILNNYDYISNNCVDAAEKFNWKDIAYQYLNIYKSLEKKRNKSSQEL